jgi:uncharacterized heparinase superfamily protein
MFDPQSELFNLLATAKLRKRAIDSIHQKSIAAIPAKQDAIAAELDELRSQIQAAGIGARPKLEDRYLTLLRDMRSLDQSYAMGEMRSPDAADPALQKSVDYGRLLLSVYGDRSLIKGASADLQYWGEKLVGSDDRVAVAIGEKLLRINLS